MQSRKLILALGLSFILMLSSLRVLAQADAMPVLEPTPLELIAPTGTITESLGNPRFAVNYIGEGGYQIYIAQADDINAALPWDWQLVLPAGLNCINDICGWDLTNFNEFFVLPNGSYQVWLHNADEPLLENWFGPFFFTIAVAEPPTFPMFDFTTKTETRRPQVNWTLDEDSGRAAWFQYYLAHTENIGSFINAGWASRVDFCGGWVETSCSFTPAIDLIWGESYSFYIQAWGPGGLTTGGVGNSGWSEPVLFTPKSIQAR